MFIELTKRENNVLIIVNKNQIVTIHEGYEGNGAVVCTSSNHNFVVNESYQYIIDMLNANLAKVARVKNFQNQ